MKRKKKSDHINLQFSTKNVSSLSIRGNDLTLQSAHGNFFIFCQMVLLPNINFLISKQNKTLEIDPKMLKQ